MSNKLLYILFAFSSLYSTAQVNYSANDTILPYEGYFRAGTNLGAYPGFSDEFLGELAAGNPATGVDGLGIKALRPGLFESFLFEYGYESRLSTYELFGQLGLEDNTLIVGFPAPEHQDPTQYCDGIQSTLFSNLYTDIWDNGENGTPVNDDNHYALYIYKLATMYGEHIKFWEIWNEPGFDYTENRGWLPPGSPGNWWENNPDPCDYKLRAPIFHYVRLLRISYEIIKTVDPSDYVTVSGVGYPSFLDAVLRNTDNPTDGSLNGNYPLKGGAYFDVMGFHSYPHFDGSLRYWDNDIMDFVLTRHSDAAADGILTLQDTLQGVLNNYGYDGGAYPLKPWIITEINLPRKEFGDFIGSAEAQRNFMIKNVVFCMQNNFLQNHIFKLAEDETYEDAFFEFDLMGLYEKLRLQDYAFQQPTDEGIAYKSASELLFAKVHDPIRTAALNLSEGVRGGAFRDEYNNYTYVLWAATSLDNSEVANATYTFPANLGINNLIKREWDFGATGERTSITAENIPLTGAPIFLTDMIFTSDITDGCAPQAIQFTDQSPTAASSWQWSFQDGTPQSSTLQNPSVTFQTPGTYTISLQSFDSEGNLLAEQSDLINIEELPQASFSHLENGAFSTFSNLSTNNSDSFLWNFGDGTTSTEPSPVHLYLTPGTYTAQLTATNFCGSTTAEMTLVISNTGSSPLTYNANDQVPVNTHHFRPGSNTAFYPPWNDRQLGDIAGGNVNEGQAGAGVRSFRTILPHYFLEFWGYDIRVHTFEHYNNLDIRDNVATIGFPSSSVQDTVAHCPDATSILFKNLYLDIWDNGENGTPINDENEYAKYLYHTVDMYKDHIRYWEILSGPDFDESGDYGWLPPGEQGNWWENDPDPCDLALHAPVQYYVRTLRISYEIIKTLDPDGYVCLAGIGFPSFVDAVLRNTDNPIDGSSVPGYDLTGGAYFDAIGYSSLPHFDGSTSYYDVDIGGFAYERHSDAAAGSIAQSKVDLETVLYNYNYDGMTYPEKQWYISSSNIPRKPFGEYIGSDIAQRNFIIKAYIESVKNNLAQFHVRQLGETASFEEANDPFQVMGLYQDLEGVQPYNQVINDQGLAYKTTSNLLFCSDYDEARTAALNLAENMNGAAFVDGNGQYTYVLWAKTTTDQTEFAAATYSFPASLNLSQLYKKSWNYSQTNNNPLVASTNIALSGTPIFLTEAETPLLTPLAMFSANVLDACPGDEIQFTDASLRADQWSWSFQGGTAANTNIPNPVVSYAAPGTFEVRLEVTNAAGSHTAIYSQYITIHDDPVAGFNYNSNGTTVNFTNASIDATSYLWDFGDNSGTTLSFDPEHVYGSNGSYEVTLIAFNDCGSDTIVQQIMLGAMPQGNFTSSTLDECEPYNVQFQDQSVSSPETWQWEFPGGIPEISDLPNPTIAFGLPGVYGVTMIVSNNFGSDTVYQSIEINPNLIGYYESIFCGDENIEINGTTYDVNNSSGTEVLENAGTNGCDSVVVINIQNGDSSSEIFPIICEGETYEIGDLELTTTGNYTWETNNSIGCDSLINIQLSVDVVSYTPLSDTIAEGMTYTVGTSVYNTTGVYMDTLVAANGCDSIVVLDLFVDIIDVVHDFSSAINLKYFPNPFDNLLTIQFDLEERTLLGIEILDIRGVHIQSLQTYQNVPSGPHSYTFDQRQLPQGVYLVRFRLADEFQVFRIVKM